MQPTLAPAPHSMRTSGTENAADQTLREHLLAQVNNTHSATLKVESLQQSNSTSPHDQNIDPAIAGAGIMSMSTGESGGDENGSDSKKGGKRELSTSKRAAQNRAAQRAFRQRKEGHIKQLEAQVKDYASLNENYKAVTHENHLLRDYIINLQSRLLDSIGEFPQPPLNLEIHHQPRSGSAAGPSPPQLPAPTAQMASPAISQLQAAAAQAVVADLTATTAAAAAVGTHSHDDAAAAAAFVATKPNEKRTRLSANTDLRAIASQIATSNPDSYTNRSVVA